MWNMFHSILHMSIVCATVPARTKNREGECALPEKSFINPILRDEFWLSCLRSPDEAVMQAVCVNILSRDHPVHIRGIRKRTLARGRSRPRHVECEDVAERTPHEAVIHTVRVDVLSCDPPQCVDALRHRALAGACARVRYVECSEVAEGMANEAVIHAIRINIVSRDPSQVADA